MAAPIPSFVKTARQHLASDLDLSCGALADAARSGGADEAHARALLETLAGRYLALLFEKPSLRTRLTFELAIKQLGGDAVICDGPIGEREPVKDVARNLDRWTHGIVARVFSQSTIEELAHWSRVPVINALSDRLSSLPGAGRRADAAGAFRPPGRPEAGLRRRRQQCGAFADADRRRGWACTSRWRRRAGYEPECRRSSRRPRESRPRSRITNDPAEAVGGRARGLYRRLGQHGPGSGSRRARPRPSRRIR